MPKPGLTPSQTVLQYFAWGHLPSPLREISGACADVAKFMETTLPDGPEKTMGLRKLLEAKDCFVRARLEAIEKPWWQTSDLNEMRAGYQQVTDPQPVQTAAETQAQAIAKLRMPTETDREKWIILGSCYGPVLSVANTNSEQLVSAECYFGFCDWTHNGTNIGLPELQTKHNESGKLK